MFGVGPGGFGLFLRGLQGRPGGGDAGLGLGPAARVEDIGAQRLQLRQAIPLRHLIAHIELNAPHKTRHRRRYPIAVLDPGNAFLFDSDPQRRTFNRGGFHQCRLRPQPQKQQYPQRHRDQTDHYIAF